MGSSRTDRMLTSQQVADMLSLHVNTVKRLGDRGEIPFVRVVSRGDRRYRISDVNAFIERNTVANRKTIG